MTKRVKLRKIDRSFRKHNAIILAGIKSVAMHNKISLPVLSIICLRKMLLCVVDKIITKINKLYIKAIYRHQHYSHI